MCPIGLGWGKRRAKMGPSPSPGAGWAGSRIGSQLRLTGGQELLGLGWGGRLHAPPPASTTFSEYIAPHPSDSAS